MARKIYKPFKRVFDVVGAAAALVVLSPLLLVLAAMVRVRLGSPVLFRQVRPGLNAEPFTLVKFRTMRDGDASDAERVTPFGLKLRATSLDELPELWNILKGEMSFVGPRPLLMEYEDYYDERQKLRSTVRPGLTGLAQVEGRNSLGWPAKLEMDAHYVESMSPISDFKILIQTLGVAFNRDGTEAPGYAVGMGRFDDFARNSKAETPASD